MSLLPRVARASLAAARPTFAAAVPRPAAAASVLSVRRFAAAASQPAQAAAPAASHASAGGHHDSHDHHDHHGPKPDGGQSREDDGGETAAGAEQSTAQHSTGAEADRRSSCIVAVSVAVLCAEDAESHTFAGLTLMKPKPWQTFGAHFFGQQRRSGRRGGKRRQSPVQRTIKRRAHCV